MATDAVAARPHPLRFARRIPATLAIAALILVLGVVSSALWIPFGESAGMQVWAYGLPALEAGRWWTPLTGAFLVGEPVVYPVVLVSFAGMALLEWRRGSRVALLYFWGGHLFAALSTSALLWALQFTTWPWAVAEAAALDVGPSGGTLACIAAAVGLIRAPWRIRAWMLLLAFVFVTMVFWGTLADIEHLLAVLLVLAVDRSLRIRRSSVREQRLIAFVSLIVLAVLEIVVLFVPTDGPFGATSPASGSFVDVAIDVVIIAVLANGLRRGRRWAWILAIGLSILNVLVLFALVGLVLLVGWAEVDDVLGGDPSLSVATGAMWMLVLVYLIWVRAAFRAHRRSRMGVQPHPSVDDVKGELRAHGGGTLSWMTTWDGNRYARTATGIVAYQRHLGVAIALADPVGPATGRAASVKEFIADAEHAGLVPCFFSAGEATRQAVPASWSSLIVADDTIVDLPDLQFKGKPWASVRTSINRAAREEVSFQLTTLKAAPLGIRQQLHAISDSWVGEKELPEMGFTLGTLTEAEDAEVRIALAMTASGTVEGFLSWLPVYGTDGTADGWTLDLMRRRDGGFPPVMEFLIGSSALAFSAEGARTMSLSGAPLTHDYPPNAGIIAALSTKLADALEPVYGFQSLHRFKEKFNPRYETLYLLYRDETDLGRIGLGLTRAFLPTASLRQLADAGIGLVRSDG